MYTIRIISTISIFVSFIMRLEQTLKDYGLKEKQIKVYLACLQLGTGSVVKIAQKAGMPRSTVYEILESLRGLGLVTTFLKKKIKYFSAEEPEHMIRFAETKVSILKDALPELNALVGKSRQRPTVRFYQGTEEMKIVLEEMLAEADSVLCFGAPEDLFRELGDYFYKLVERRIKKKIPVRLLALDSARARERKERGPKELRTVKILPRDYEFHGNIWIWKNKIAMFSFTGDLVAVVIESRELADMQKALFENLWERC